MYVRSPDQTTIGQRYAELPDERWVQDTVDPPTGHYVRLTAANAAEHGYYEIDGTAVKPADTATTTWERSFPFVDGRFVLTWVERPKTQDELDQDANETERTQVRNAIQALRDYIDNPAPNGSATVAVVKLLCRIAIRLVRDNYS